MTGPVAGDKPVEEPLAGEADLRETIEALAVIDRPPHSPGEREAAEWIRDRFERIGLEARVEEELSDPYYAPYMAALSAVGTVAGLIGARRRSPLAALAAAAAAVAIGEDSANGPRLFRRLVTRKKTTWNAVAEAGDPDAERTLVLLAHHDASNTGFIFDQGPQKKVWELNPELIERTDTSVPMWWIVIAGPLLAALGAATGSRKLSIAGAAASTGAAISFADIARSPVVPGANDNLSGVAVQVAFAEALRERPIEGLRVVLASCGSEEVLQGGVIGFFERHGVELPPQKTWVINNDSVGSPNLALLEGEGTIVMEEFESSFKDMVEGVAAESQIRLRRGLRTRLSTDAVIPHRAGYPVANFTSVTDWKAVANYHWPTDTPENVDYATVGDAAKLTYLVAEKLAKS